MIVLRHPSELKPPPGRVCLAVGFFDGVHLGHQQVIRLSLGDASQRESHPVVVTFDRHPTSVVAPERAPGLIYSLERKLQTLEALAVPTTLLLRFDQSLCRKPADQFIAEMAEQWGAIDSICVGSRFRFGHRRQGDVALLERLGRDLGFAVHGLAAVALDGEPVSSTRIREAIRQGDLDRAGQMLGRPYVLAGRVQAGERRGRELGFPTANLDVEGLVLPPGGVYAVHAQLGKQEHRGVLNLGTRPTVREGGTQVSVEVHLLDFEGDLYGRELEISFVRHLRQEQRFPSLKALQRQIEEDVRTARAVFPVRD